MCPYYEWSSKKDKFVKCPKPQKKYFEVSCRLAKNSDKKLLLDFENECVKTEPEIFKAELEYHQKRLQSIPIINFNHRENFKVVMALVDKREVVGELSMGWYFNYEVNSKVGVITGLWVLKPYRMAGIGKKLIGFAKNEFKKWEIKRIALIVGLFNLAAQVFYKKLGFRIRNIGEAISEC